MTDYLPTIDLPLAELLQDPSNLHEQLVDVLGQYVLWLRNWSVDSSKRIVSTPNAAQNVPTIRFERYAGVASMPPEQQEAACQFAEATLDRYIQLLLNMLSGTGVDHLISPSHAVRFKLDMEILDVDNDDIVATETLNRNGQKFFADYWGRWLNQFGKRRRPMAE